MTEFGNEETFTRLLQVWRFCFYIGFMAVSDYTQGMNERIVLDSSVHHGKPLIRGTRVPVATIISGLAGGMSTQEVAREYEIEIADIEAALSYAADLIESERAVALAK